MADYWVRETLDFDAAFAFRHILSMDFEKNIDRRQAPAKTVDDYNREIAELEAEIARYKEQYRTPGTTAREEMDLKETVLRDPAAYIANAESDVAKAMTAEAATIEIDLAQQKLERLQNERSVLIAAENLS